MTENEKQLILKDLCARLPYGVICHTEEGDGYLCSINQTIFGTEYGLNINPLKRDYFNDSETDEQAIKPYLRPMSSMTEEELRELNDKYDSIAYFFIQKPPYYYGLQAQHEDIGSIKISEFSEIYDWLNAHHFDYCGLIEKGLALEAPEEMYKTE